MIIRFILVTIFTLYLFSGFAQKPAWVDNFSKGTLELKYWTIIPRGQSQWDKYMSSDPKLYRFKLGSIGLGVSSEDGIKTSGIYTRGKIHFRYGRLEIKAKIECAQGVWPAIWMKPVDDIKTPYGGELDIMEHLNHDQFVYQTVHSGYTHENKYRKRQNRGRQNYVKTPVDIKKYNIYAVEHHRDYIAFFLNGVETLRYNRKKAIRITNGPLIEIIS